MIGLLTAAVLNPLLTLFPGELTFLESFDDASALPLVGVPPAGWREPKLEFAKDGVMGGCLSAGRVTFSLDAFGHPLMEVSSGTAVCWVRYLEDVDPKGPQPAFFFFAADLKQPGKPGRIQVFKQANHGDMVGLYESFAENGRRCTAAGRVDASYAKWPKGTWKMVAFAWTPDKVGLSVDGSPFDESPYQKPLGAICSFSFQADYLNGPRRFFQLDECAVLNRNLSDAEIRRVYETFCLK